MSMTVSGYRAASSASVESDARPDTSRCVTPFRQRRVFLYFALSFFSLPALCRRDALLRVIHAGYTPLFRFHAHIEGF